MAPRRPEAAGGRLGISDPWRDGRTDSLDEGHGAGDVGGGFVSDICVRFETRISSAAEVVEGLGGCFLSGEEWGVSKRGRLARWCCC